VKWRDPSGLLVVYVDGRGWGLSERIEVTAPYLPEFLGIDLGGTPGGSGGGGGGEPLERAGSDNPEAHQGLYYNPFPRPPENSQSPPSSVPSQNPSTPSATTSQSFLPSSSGVIVVADAASGSVEGVAGTYSLMFGGFTPASGGTDWAGFESHGAFIGSPRAGVSTVNPRSVNQTPGVVGASAGLGFGAWFSNAQTPAALYGPFATYSVPTPLFGVTYSYTYWNGQYIYVFALTVGPTLGGSYNAYPTTTDPLGY